MKKLLIPVLVLAVFAACKKKSTEPDQRALLVDRKWTVTEEYLRDSTGHTSADLWPSEASYVKDDYVIWYGAGTYSNIDGGTLAPGHTVPQYDTGNWQLNSSVISMTSIKPGYYVAPFTITSITSDRMTVEVSMSQKRTGMYTLRPL